MKPLPTVYIAPIETMTSPPGYKLFYCAKMFQFLESIGNHGLPHDTQFSYALASFSRFGLHYSYVDLGDIHFLPKLLPVQNVVFDLRSMRSSLSVRVFSSTPRLSIPPGVGSGACALCGAPATVLVTPALLERSRFAFGQSFSSALPNSGFTKQHSFLIEALAYKTPLVPRSTFRLA